jgi:hypothetical protein
MTSRNLVEEWSDDDIKEVGTRSDDDIVEVGDPNFKKSKLSKVPQVKIQKIKMPEEAFNDLPIGSLTEVVNGLAKFLKLGTSDDPESPIHHLKIWYMEKQAISGGVRAYHHEGIVSLFLQPDGIDIINENRHLFNFESVNFLTSFRGLKFDIVRRKIVCPSFGHTRQIQADSIEEASAQISINAPGFDIHSGFINVTAAEDGVVLMVTRYLGEDLICTHRRVDTRGSYTEWGRDFQTLYKEFGGPSHDYLFEEMKTSNLVYYFILSHKSVVQASKKPVGDGYLTYLGYKQIRETTQEVKQFTVKTYDQINLDDGTVKIITPGPEEVNRVYETVEIIEGSSTRDLSPEAKNILLNNFLTGSYFPQNSVTGRSLSFCPGGSLIIIKKMHDGSINPVFRVSSSSYRYHNFIQGDGQVMGRLQLFKNISRSKEYGEYEYMFTTLATPMVKSAETGELFPLFEAKNQVIFQYISDLWQNAVENGVEEGHVTFSFPEDLQDDSIPSPEDRVIKPKDMKTSEHIFINACLIYILTAPPSKQAEIIKAMGDILTEADFMEEYLMSRDSEDIHARVNNSPTKKDVEDWIISNPKYNSHVSWVKAGSVTKGVSNLISFLFSLKDQQLPFKTQMWVKKMRNFLKTNDNLHSITAVVKKKIAGPRTPL